MEYNKIIAVTGLPGLYELLSSKSDGAIVRSLDDKTTRFVSSRIHNFSHLESIEVYTVRDNVNLVDILKAMEANAGKLPDEKDGADLKAYFTKVYPDLDFGRVYSSDLKKMVKWYSVLKANNIEIKLSEPEEEAPEETEVEEAPAAPIKEAAPKKKAAEEAAKANTISLEEFLEVERHKLGSNLTPVTKETFAVWKKTRMNKKEAEMEVLKKTKDAQHAAGKASGMSGRDLVRMVLLF